MMLVSHVFRALFLGHSRKKRVSTVRWAFTMTARRDMSAPDLLSTKTVMLKFLKVQLDIATTFVQSAKAASNLKHRQWKCSQARKAYDTVAQMMNRVTLSKAEAEFLSDRLAVLKTKLQQFGELS